MHFLGILALIILGIVAYAIASQPGAPGRLGVVLGRLGTGLAILLGLGALYGAMFGYGDSQWFGVAMLAIPAALAYLIGRALRFVLSGT